MSKYQNGRVYKIVSSGGVYVGSTIYPLEYRLRTHLSSLNSYKAGKIRYITVHDVLDYDDVDIIQLEFYPCDYREQLLLREKYWINQIECVNKCNPIREEGDAQEYHREYHQKMKNDPDYIAMRKRCQNKPEQKIKKRDYERKRRQTDEEHAERRRESYRKWFEANKDKHNARRREKRALAKKQN